MSAWLEAVAEVSRRAWGARTDWLLVGDAAAAFQGAALEPSGVDVGVRTPSDAARLAAHLADLAVAEPTAHDPITFRSSLAEPLLSFADDRGVWALGRWVVGGVRLEITHLSPPAPVGLQEVAGERVWQVRRDVAAHGLTVPCVPLEVQVVTAHVRRDAARRDAIAAALQRRSVDGTLLAEALRGQGYTPASIAHEPALIALLPPQLRPPGHRTTGGQRPS